MMDVYLDESYDDLVLSVAGWIADPRAWDAFQEPWRDRVLSAGLSPLQAFHMADLENQLEACQGWNRDRDCVPVIRAAVDTVLDTAIIQTLRGVGCAVRVSRSQRHLIDWSHLYVEAFWNVFNVVWRWHRDSDGIRFVLDENDPMRAEVDEGIVGAKRIFARTHPPYAEMIEGHSFENDKKFAGLQAADLLAYEVRRSAAFPDVSRTSYCRLIAGRDHVFAVCDVEQLPILKPTHGRLLSWRLGDDVGP